jgi:hypothetical protein
VSGHWSAWQAARVEVKQAEEKQASEQKDLPGEIIERVVEDTDLSANDGSGSLGADSSSGDPLYRPAASPDGATSMPGTSWIRVISRARLTTPVSPYRMIVPRGPSVSAVDRRTLMPELSNE